MVTVSADFFGWYSLANRRFFSVFQCLIAFSYGKTSISGPVANLISVSNVSGVPYFLGYKTDFFFFQNNPKDLDPSYKMDLDL